MLPATSYPQVSKTMPLIIEFIQGLIQKEAAYAAPNGDVYFSVISDDDYGRLSGRKLEDMQAGARIEVGEQKEHPMDFALWKAAKPGEISWDSPWGKGRPGWHIEGGQVLGGPIGVRPGRTQTHLDALRGAGRARRRARVVPGRLAVRPRGAPLGDRRHREAGVAALDVFSEWKSVYVDFSGRLQRAQIDTAEV